MNWVWSKSSDLNFTPESVSLMVDLIGGVDVDFFVVVLGWVVVGVVVVKAIVSALEGLTVVVDTGCFNVLQGLFVVFVTDPCL